MVKSKWERIINLDFDHEYSIYFYIAVLNWKYDKLCTYFNISRILINNNKKSNLSYKHTTNEVCVRTYNTNSENIMKTKSTN